MEVLKENKDKRGFTEIQAAHYIGMSRAFLRKDRMQGPKKGPKFIKVGRSVLYLKEELDRWLDKHIDFVEVKIVQQGNGLQNNFQH